MSVDTATLEVARDAIAEHRFDALPEIAEQSPEITAVIVGDLLRAVSILAADGAHASVSIHQLDNVAALREALLAGGGEARGVYAEMVTHANRRGEEWDAAGVHFGNSSIHLYSKHRPRTKKPRKRKAVSK